MLKKVLSFGGVEALAKGTNWLSLSLLPILLSVEEYAKIGLLVAVQSFLNLFFVAGQDKFIFRFYRGPKSAKVHFNVLLFLFMLGIVSTLACGGYMLISGTTEVFSLDPVLLFGIIWGMVLFSSNKISLSIIRLNSNVREYTTNRLVYQFSFLIILAVVAYLTRMSYSYVVAMMGAALTILLIEYRVGLLKLKPDFSNTKYYLKILLLWSLPFIMHSASKSVLMFVDRFLIQQYGGTYDLGIYSFSYQIGQSMSFLFFALNVYFEPIYYKSEGENILTKFFLTSNILAGLFLVGLLAIFPLVVTHFYPADYFNSLDYILGLSCSFLLNLYYIGYANRLVKHKRVKFLAMSTFIAASINLTINFILIPKLGIKGAVLTNWISYSVLAYITGFFYKKNIMPDKHLAVSLAVTATLLFVPMSNLAACLILVAYVGINAVTFYYSRKLKNAAKDK